MYSLYIIYSIFILYDSNTFISFKSCIIPKHKKAFVRQLPKAEIIIDYENECMTQLTRFGFKVLLYSLKMDVDDSSLGSSLLSWEKVLSIGIGVGMK